MARTPRRATLIPKPGRNWRDLPRKVKRCSRAVTPPRVSTDGLLQISSDAIVLALF